jgi:hypothetical protein
MLQEGRVRGMPLMEAMSTVQPAGAAAAAARSRAALKESWRRLPAMPRIVLAKKELRQSLPSE